MQPDPISFCARHFLPMVDLHHSLLNSLLNRNEIGVDLYKTSVPDKTYVPATGSFYPLVLFIFSGFSVGSTQERTELHIVPLPGNFQCQADNCKCHSPSHQLEAENGIDHRNRNEKAIADAGWFPLVVQSDVALKKSQFMEL